MGVAAVVAALGALAIAPAPGLASNDITVAAGGTSIDVNGTSIPTSNLNLEELGKLQGVPASTVNLELEGVAAGTPDAPAVDTLVSTLTGTTPLAMGLGEISAASGGTISRATELERVVEDNGQPGASGGDNGGTGSTGAAGANGSTGANAGAPGAAGTSAAKKTLFTLRVSSRSLKGHPGKRVRVTYTLSSAATLNYSGRKLSKGERKVRSGKDVLVIELPRRHGNYYLTLRALSASEGQIAQTTIALHDAPQKASAKH